MTYIAKRSAKINYESCITSKAKMRFVHPLQIPQVEKFKDQCLASVYDDESTIKETVITVVYALT
jgi:hypothetical protein